MERIYKGKCVSPEASEAFLTLLLNQEHVNKIPAGLPERTKCANKTGDTDEVQHDAAINNIQDISKTVYDYFN